MIKIIADVFEIQTSEIDDSFSMDTYSRWDSLMHLVIISELEAAFDIVLDPDEIGTINSIKKLSEVINHKLSR